MLRICSETSAWSLCLSVKLVRNCEYSEDLILNGEIIISLVGTLSSCCAPQTLADT